MQKNDIKNEGESKWLYRSRETHINCVEHTQLCVQKDLFSSFKALKIKNILHYEC